MAAEKSDERGRGESSRGSLVYRSLIEEIRAGELKPGDRIREETVAASLGVSRTPVREACARLQARGLLEITQGGLAVAALTRSQVMELYALRARLEGDAAAFAAENASVADITAIGHAADLMNGRELDPSQAARANRMFHEAIYDAAHNRYLLRMLEDLNDSLALLPKTTFSVKGRAAAANWEHRAIFEAIVRRDVDGAEKSARAHILMALEARLKITFMMVSGS